MEKKNQNQADTSRANQNGHLDLLTTEPPASLSLAHDMSGSLAGEMSALGKRLGIHITSGGWRDGVFEDRNGAGDEGTGSDLASDQQADDVVAGRRGAAAESAATASALLAVSALWLRRAL